MPCLVLTHNEGAVLVDFFRHYRAIGRMNFLVVDDRSDDGTFDFLMNQPDATIFRPKEGSNFAQHKREWRAILLDHFADDRWAIVPDVDEHLIWHDFETRSLHALLNDLESEGAEGLYCTMVDMYKSGPLAAQTYLGNRPLEDEFTLFDDPRLDPLSYRSTLAPHRFMQNWPTPRMFVHGGMRDRISRGQYKRNGLLAFLQKRLPTIRSVEPTGTGWFVESILKVLLRPEKGDMPALNMTKIPLVKWKSGSRFYSGQHALNRHYRLSKETGVLLHFPITKGEVGIRYNVDRGQHAANSAYYRGLLGVADQDISYEGTSEFRSSRDLSAFLRK